MAARKGGDDPHMNPGLDLVLQKARYYSLPREVIDKALKKWSGKLEGHELQEVMYEGYGPAGSALYIKCITSNTNRATAEIRATMSRMGGTMAEPGAVSRQFDQKGVIIINGKAESKNEKWREVHSIIPYEKNQLEEDLLNLDIDDFDEQDGQCRVITSREAFINVKKGLEELHYNISDADIQYLPQNEITLADDAMATFEGLIEALEELEDVDSIYHNIG